MLSFQRLDVYQRSVEFLALSSRLIAGLPKWHTALARLRRAALSVPLGMAEATGRTSERDGARHQAIAHAIVFVAVAVAVNDQVNVDDDDDVPSLRERDVDRSSLGVDDGVAYEL